MIVILDYGFGNVRSAQKAFEAIGYECSITADESKVLECDGLVIPGVGAFSACINAIKQTKADTLIHERLKQEKPIFGICVGFQILFQSSTEGQKTKGLGLLDGEVEKLNLPILPHMGWGTAKFKLGDIGLYKGLENDYFYYVHSYGVLMKNKNPLEFLSSYESKLISGTQFHPEKSGRSGLKLLKNWCETL
jgi:glutamine amidotransferase